jgi:serine/threonine-protein kinase RsbW
VPSNTPPLEGTLEDLYENAPCGYLSLLSNGEIARVNRTFLTWTGYRRTDIVGRRRFQDLLTAGGKIYHETHYAPLLRMQGAVRTISLDIVRADGSTLPVLVNSVVKTDAAGRPLLTFTTVFDATDRKEYERELLRARRRERAARERTERLQRITAILAAIGADEIGERIVDELAAITRADHAALALIDPGADGADRIVRRGDDSLAALAEQVGSGSADAPGAGDPVFSEAPEHHRAAFPTGDTAKAPAALAALPLGPGGRLAGVILLGFDRAREFSEEDRGFMLACARQCGQALERARLHAETVDAARRAEFMARTTRALDEAQGFVERAQRLVDMLVPEFADAACVRDVGAGGEDCVAASHRDERARRQLGERGASGERSSVELPLSVRGRPLGNLVLVRSKARPFSARDVGFLGGLADRCALALENARLYEQERDAAQTLQRSLLAGELPQDDRFTIATTYRPAVEGLEVGGDWYDAFRLSEGTIAVVVGDVVGRGIEAASAMGQLRSAVRALAAADQGPAQLLESLDRFVEPLERARVATVAYAEIALDSGLMRFARAGHPPPLLVEGPEQPRFLWDALSTPLGANLKGLPRTEAELTLRPGARLLLYTDGLVERRDQPLEVGLERLAEEFAQRRAAPLPALVNELVDAMRVGARTDDDVCLLCFASAGGSRLPRGRTRRGSPT